MNEAHAFLAMFTIQILVGSVLFPALFIRRVRAQVARFPVERFAKLFPGLDQNLSAQRFATRHRALNTGIAVLGLLLLGWLFSRMGRPHWYVPGFSTLYFVAQASPLYLIGWKQARYNKALKYRLAEGKRKAVLQRRGLFDFVSPFIVVLAVLSYFLFAALVLYIRPHPLPGFGGLTDIGLITLCYAFCAFVAFGFLYGKKPSPLVTHADRLYAIGVVVKSCVYACIAVSVFASLDLTLALLHLSSWDPFAVSGFCVFVFIGMMSPPLRPKPDGLGSDGPLPPGVRDLSA